MEVVLRVCVCVFACSSLIKDISLTNTNPSCGWMRTDTQAKRNPET